MIGMVAAARQDRRQMANNSRTGRNNGMFYRNFRHMAADVWNRGTTGLVLHNDPRSSNYFEGSQPHSFSVMGPFCRQKKT
ncbi:hypothetical protein CEXT_38111 [Caerostris extrusa]|uniref:Uncharacterized protein n=1 Tax=Caerostris extrusa TaxID=172846 RepID=A0AAV4PVB8_CAEEX|nr:hypothetical protein CEXT_38111 [Caerostris extrusa]